MIIKAMKFEELWMLVNEENKPVIDLSFESRSEAYKACESLWPARSVWKGKKINSGYRIYEEF